MVTVNSKHHRGGRLELSGEQLVLGGHRQDYIPKARREAQRAADFLRPALVAAGRPQLAGRLVVRPMIAVVGGRLLIRQWAPGVTVVMTRQVPHALRSMPAVLTPSEVGTLYGLARRSTTRDNGPHP